MIIDFRYIIDSGKVISFRTGDVSYGGNDDDDVIADWLPATEPIQVRYVDENGVVISGVPIQDLYPPFKRSQIAEGMKIENVSLRFGENSQNITRITKLNTKGIRSFTWMFNLCRNLDFSTLPKLDMSEATRTDCMFQDCSQLTEDMIPELDTGKVEKMYGMFRGCTSLTTTPQLNTGNVTNMSYMFQGCTSLTTVSQLNIYSVFHMSSMFSGCTSLVSVPQLDTSNAMDMSSMFSGCTKLSSVPPIVAPNCTNFENMFLDCPAIQEVDITTPKATNIKGIFRNCSDLRRVKNMYTGKATAVNNFFSTTATDYKLTEIPTMDFSSCTASNTMNGFFVNRKGIRHMDITGAIHRGCTFYSIFDEDTLVQILQACNRTTTTYGKKMAFKDMQTLTDTADGQYAALMAECTAKGWTFTNFTINPAA